MTSSWTNVLVDSNTIFLLFIYVFTNQVVPNETNIVLITS